MFGRLGDAEGIARMARQVIELELDPADRYEAQLAFAEVYREAGEFEKSERAYREALALAPENPMAYVGLRNF